MFSIISNNTKEYLLQRLKDETGVPREDNRTHDKYRKISITPLTKNLNSPIEVKIGETLIISQIYSKLTSPYIDKPNEGIISFSIDTNYLKPNADYNVSNEDLNEFRIKISNYLEKSLRESKALDSNSLCVIPNKLVWKIVIDINIINYDGNATDASLISALASWLTYKIPFLRVKNNKIYYDNFINLTLIHMPISITYGILLNEDKILFILDCDLLEENVMNGFISICANIFKEICYMQMNSNVQVGSKDIKDLTNNIHVKIKEIHNIIKKFVKDINLKYEKIIKKKISMLNNDNDIKNNDDNDYNEDYEMEDDFENFGFDNNEIDKDVKFKEKINNNEEKMKKKKRGIQILNYKKE